MTHRILVVEVQEDLREIARFALEGAGYEAIEAATGAESIAKADHPPLVPMGIQLPGWTVMRVRAGSRRCPEWRERPLSR